ncbi:MAG: hypothetical protein IJH87_00380, partial [Atopobiaceae bacterium]|nr:hypothetical protein [Atopobiaceae bacterium]
MVFRIFVEKHSGFDVEATHLKEELQLILGVSGLTDLRLINRYDVEGIDRELFDRVVPTVFSEPMVDFASEFLFLSDTDDIVFAVEYLPGQFDQ